MEIRGNSPQAMARRGSRRCPWALGLMGTGGRRAPSTPVVCLTSYTGRFEKMFSFSNSFPRKEGRGWTGGCQHGFHGTRPEL